MKKDYKKLAEKYLRIAKQVTQEMQTDKDVIGIAAIGSTARGDVHHLSDIDLLVLVKGIDVFQWKRKLVQNIVVNVAIRSTDVFEKMTKEHPDTVFGLKGALIFYDPRGILQSLKKSIIITEPTEKEFRGDLLDEARSFIGKAERALDESRLESAILCLRQGAIRLAELMLFEYKRNRVNPMYMWEEIKAAPLSVEFKKLFFDIQGLRVEEKLQLINTLRKLKTFLPNPTSETYHKS